MPKRQRNVLIVGGLVAAAIICWYWWRADDGSQLVAGPISVSYDPEATRLTAVVNIRNSGDRPLVASITNNVFVDSQKQPVNDRTQRQPWHTYVGSKQSNAVTFTVEGEPAAAVWNGVRLMEVTIDAFYDYEDEDEQRAKLTCHFSFMGRFYPELKQIGIVSNVTLPRACRMPLTAPSHR